MTAVDTNILGLQLTAERGQDSRLLRAAVRLHRMLLLAWNAPQDVPV